MPDHPPDAVQALAAVDDHVSMDDAPAAMLAGDAERDTDAIDGGRGALLPLAVGDSLAPPPPQAASTRAAGTSSRCLARSKYAGASSTKLRTSERTATACSAFMTLHTTPRIHTAECSGSHRVRNC